MSRAVRRTRALTVIVVGILLAAGTATAAAGPAAGRWHLDDYGSPVSEATYIQPVGAVSVRQGIDGEERPWVFTVIAGQLYAVWSDPGGAHWLPLGAPPKSEISAPVGVVTVQDDLYAPQRPYVFVQTVDGHLWLNWFDGGGWQWDDRGTPTDGVLLPYGTRVGVVNLRLGPEDADWPQAFVLDNQRRVWRNGWDGSRWTWTNHGTPHGMSLPDSRGLGALSVRDAPGGAAWPHAFVGAYGYVFELSGAGGEWQWVYHPDAFGFEFLNPVGAVAVQDKPSVGDRPYLFVVDRYGGPVWSDWWSGRSWEWTEQVGTDAEMLGYLDSGAAVTIQDTPESPQRPYVFYWSSSWPRKLMVNWWG
ncbi:hypothetical protein ACN28C_20370 [Plantactinospora sp. WMMC1484]|uniref:hypothetical protein n=1 Tax=Plantactinospora sp. WMMC1484 TaxID=3404122 RepID=UPI003BF474CB